MSLSSLSKICFQQCLALAAFPPPILLGPQQDIPDPGLEGARGQPVARRHRPGQGVRSPPEGLHRHAARQDLGTERARLRRATHPLHPEFVQGWSKS